MSIQNEIRIINRTEQLVETLKKKYAELPLAVLELNKLKKSLQELLKSLHKLDELKPHSCTHEINQYFEAINVHLDILKVEIAKKDYAKLNKKIKILKTLSKFHPAKYSFLKFITAWIMEFFYFV